MSPPHLGPGGGRGGGATLTCGGFASIKEGERYEVNTLSTAGGGGGGNKRLMGENPFKGPLEGVGPENRDFFGP